MLAPFVCTGVNYEKIDFVECKRTSCLCYKRALRTFFKDVDADIFCLQETKLKRDRLTSCLKDIISIGAMPTKKAIQGGYVHKEEPLNVCYRIGIDEHDHEGRVITAEFDNCFVVTCYTPNSQSELKNLITE